MTNRSGDRPHPFLRGVALGLTVLLMGCSSPATELPPEAEQLTASNLPPGAQLLPISARARMGNAVIQLEVAQTPAEKATGLMFRPALPASRGMLFLFEPARPVQFWMRNVPVPLDMVFLREGEVKTIAAEVPPCTTPSCPTYGPTALIDQVIELRAGRAAELGLEVGDRVIVEAISP
jgi:uncharacterized protein